MQNQNQAKPVVELVMTNHAGQTIIVQVRDNASFHDFYIWQVKVGEIAKTTDRNLNDKHGTVRIEDIPAHIDAHAWKPELRIVSSKITYYDHERYEALLKAPPDELGQGLVKSSGLIGDDLPLWEPRKPIRIRWENSSMKTQIR